MADTVQLTSSERNAALQLHDREEQLVGSHNKVSHPLRCSTRLTEYHLPKTNDSILCMLCI